MMEITVTIIKHNFRNTTNRWGNRALFHQTISIILMALKMAEADKGPLIKAVSL